MTENHPPRNVGLDLVRVTEAAALVAARWLGWLRVARVSGWSAPTSGHAKESRQRGGEDQAWADSGGATITRPSDHRVQPGVFAPTVSAVRATRFGTLGGSSCRRRGRRCGDRRSGGGMADGPRASTPAPAAP